MIVKNTRKTRMMLFVTVVILAGALVIKYSCTNRSIDQNNVQAIILHDRQNAAREKAYIFTHQNAISSDHVFPNYSDRKMRLCTGLDAVNSVLKKLEGHLKPFKYKEVDNSRHIIVFNKGESDPIHFVIDDIVNWPKDLEDYFVACESVTDEKKTDFFEDELLKYLGIYKKP